MPPHAAWLVDPAALGPFLMAVLLVELTPGPNMAYLAALSMAQGRAAGLRAVAGVTLGLSVYMLGAVFGVASVVAREPFLYLLLRYAGAAYLFWLAWEAWRGAGENSPAVAPEQDLAPFRRGLLVNLLNPKAALFYVTLLPGFIAADHGPFAQQALIFGAGHLVISVIVHTAIVLAAALAARNLALERTEGLRRGLAIGIGLIGMWLLWETGR